MDMIFIIEQTIVNIKLHNLIDTITRNIGVKLGDGKSTSYIIWLLKGQWCKLDNQKSYIIIL